MVYNIVTLVVSVTSLLVSLVATALAKQSLDEAKRVADRDSNDWKQRKWFELYFEAEKAYDALDQFQCQYVDGAPDHSKDDWKKYVSDVNVLASVIRRVHSMAAVFPMTPELDKLFHSTVFPNDNDLLSIDRKTAVFDAVEGIRQKALIKNLDILGE